MTLSGANPLRDDPDPYDDGWWRGFGVGVFTCVMTFFALWGVRAFIF